MTAGMNDEQIERMSRTMFRFCLSRTGSYHDAEDLAQEILLIACRADHHFEDEKAFCAFVWKTAGNILKSWYRRQAGQHTEEPDENLPDHR
jgi:RNA polymerase sigma factor (sigma-70 family)